ncbi:hypothetical protein Zmor_010486 [Zophobas morio]|uniref:Uncharacterized protein n=2 Tax=Zophobas morio TaxID=2755281 RepID=A0AA38INQ0_9CUCU|nr:hypothetical protein Zmor_010486 [Zophobas morio]
MVVDVGLDMQKYNPEVKPMTNLQNVDPRVADLVDKLRHVHHMAMSSIGSTGAEVDYMQRDGFEGSGSGNGPDDDNDDEYNPTGSGSGTGAIPEEEPRNINNVHASPGPKNTDSSSKNKQSTTTTAGDASTLQSSIFLSLALLLLARLH